MVASSRCFFVWLLVCWLIKKKKIPKYQIWKKEMENFSAKTIKKVIFNEFVFTASFSVRFLIKYQKTILLSRYAFTSNDKVKSSFLFCLNRNRKTQLLQYKISFHFKKLIDVFFSSVSHRRRSLFRLNLQENFLLKKKINSIWYKQWTTLKSIPKTPQTYVKQWKNEIGATKRLLIKKINLFISSSQPYCSKVKKRLFLFIFFCNRKKNKISGSMPKFKAYEICMRIFFALSLILQIFLFM